VIGDAAVEVGPALFFSLLIITLSFIPVFTLEAQEGRLFSPLAFTKTYAMAASAGLSVTLVPVLMGYLIRGRIPDEKQPAEPRLIAATGRCSNGAARGRRSRWRRRGAAAGPQPVAAAAHRRRVHAAAGRGRPAVHAVGAAGPVGRQGRRAAAADRPLIKTRARSASVYGKAGRAETATDPAPLEMFETTIQFKPKSEWRAGMTQDKLVEELDRIVKVPGLANIWVPPIRNRIDMLATGIKSPVGVKVAGPTWRDRPRHRRDRAALKDVPGVSSALAERLTGGRYVDVNIDRDAAARFGMNIADVQSVITSASAATTSARRWKACSASRSTCATRARSATRWRSCAAAHRQTPRGARLVLSDVADVRITDGPPMLRSENARLSGLGLRRHPRARPEVAVQDMQKAVAEKVKLPPGYSVSWSGQFEFLERATAKLKVVVPFTLLIIFVLLYLTFKRFDEALLIMATLPFALVGGIWLLYLLGYNLSVAGAVGFIALAGVSAEFGVIMLLYLKHAWEARLAARARRRGRPARRDPRRRRAAGAAQGHDGGRDPRRPVPDHVGHGTGSEVMQRIAAPMVGGMITAPLLSMFVIPAAYLLMRPAFRRAAPPAGTA
jgi:Cu(I)/Ag(I) efflux system membrane protein CusA/SilA